MAPKKTGKKAAPKTKKVVKKGAKKPAAKKGTKKTAPKAKKKPSKKAKKVVVKKAAAPKKPKPELKAVEPRGAFLTKSEITNNLCAATGLSRKEGKGVFEALFDIGRDELKKGRKFVVPGIARFTVKSRPARPARKGINPFTQEECIFKAKPASKVVKAAPVRVFKEI